MKNRVLIVIASCIFLFGIIGSIIVLNLPRKNTVRIIQNSKVIYTLDLSEESDRSFTVECESGSNTVEIKDGKIRVSEADCPDKVCVRSGWLSSSGMPIVCLPHGLVIEFCESDGRVDAITE